MILNLFRKKQGNVLELKIKLASKPLTTRRDSWMVEPICSRLSDNVPFRKDQLQHKAFWQKCTIPTSEPQRPKCHLTLWTVFAAKLPMTTISLVGFLYRQGSCNHQGIDHGKVNCHIVLFASCHRFCREDGISFYLLVSIIGGSFRVWQRESRINDWIKRGVSR